MFFQNSSWSSCHHAHTPLLDLLLVVGWSPHCCLMMSGFGLHRDSRSVRGALWRSALCTALGARFLSQSAAARRFEHTKLPWKEETDYDLIFMEAVKISEWWEIVIINKSLERCLVWVKLVETAKYGKQWNDGTLDEWLVIWDVFWIFGCFVAPGGKWF